LLSLLCLTIFTFTPCCSCSCALLRTPCYFHFRVLLFMPCCLRCFAFVTLLLSLPCCSHLVTLVVRALLFTLPYFCCLIVFATLFVLTCSHLVALSCWLMALLPYHRALLVIGPCCPAIAPW
jgi:hypothetical protein